MRVSEAAWIASALADIPVAARGPLLNVGSSTAAFREKKQPHIDHLVFAPLRAAGVEVVHTDLKPEIGVDVAGDLREPTLQAALRARAAGVVLCSNMLEHVADPPGLARILRSLVSAGHLVVTVPHSYPYHPDPIDTGYRPTPSEIGALFPDCEVIRAEIVEDTTLLGEFIQSGTSGLVSAARLMCGALRPIALNGRIHRGRLPWLVRRFSASCVVLRTRR